MKLTVFNFKSVPIGTLVEHTDHWLKESCSKKRKTGLLVDKRFYDGNKVGFPGVNVVCWPVIWWEGECMGHGCHPANARPKKKHLRNSYEIDDDRD